MYLVTSEPLQRLVFTRRADAFAKARKWAREFGWSRWEDAMGIEQAIAFRRNDSGRAVICRCSAESRLLRAIFNDPHPTDCNG